MTNFIMNCQQSFIVWTQKTTIPQTISQILKKKVVRIKLSERWEQIEIIFPFIQEWNIIELQFYLNKKIEIIQNISHISFPHLCDMNFRFNRIQSIEGFSRIFLPQLTRLWIGIEGFRIDNNQIWSVSDLRKVSYPMLTDLSLHENKILEGKRLSELAGKKINMIRIEYNTTAQQIINTQWLFKIETNCLSTLRMANEKRIRREYYRTVLKKKEMKVNLL